MKNRRLCFACLLFILIQSLMFIVTGGASVSDIPANSIFQNKNGQEVIVQGQVYKKSNKSNFQILYLKNQSKQDSHFYVYVKTPISISIGETLRLKGQVQAFENARNSGNFDQLNYYARQKIYGIIWCDQILDISGKEHVWMETIYQFKEKWKEQFIHHLGEENGAVLSAMLLGEKSEMDAEVKELYQKSGIGHLLAISGLHISFIGLGVYKLLRKVGVPMILSGYTSILVISLYAMMIGFSVSVFRAYMMLLIRLGAELTGRVYDIITALFLSATLTLMISPGYLTDAGFLLSYGAIIGILFVLPAMETSFPKKGVGLSALRCSLSINLTLFPILLWFYYEFPTYSILLNLIAIPLMSLLLGSGLCGSVFLWCPPIRFLCFWICKQVLFLYEQMGEWGSSLPFARIVFGKPPLWMIVLYYLGLAFVLLLVKRGKKKKSWIWGICAFSVCLMGIRFDQDLRVTMIDVGQGDCMYIQGPCGGTYLIDGGSSDVEQVGKYRIEPFLKSQGVGCLDYVFITHGDLDHCNGVEELIARQDVGVKIKYLVLPGNDQTDEMLKGLSQQAKKMGIQVLRMETGSFLKEEGLTIQCIQPDADSSLSGNAGSVVLELRYGNFEMLCTGDVEAEGEELLTRRLKGKTYDVLKVAHHGSKNSTSSEFLQVVRPKIALISAGKNNSYQHPHSDTVKRLEGSGCDIYQTLKSGAITLISDGNSLTISLLAFRL